MIMEFNYMWLITKGLYIEKTHKFWAWCFNSYQSFLKCFNYSRKQFPKVETLSIFWGPKNVLFEECGQAFQLLFICSKTYKSDSIDKILEFMKHSHVSFLLILLALTLCEEDYFIYSKNKNKEYNIVFFIFNYLNPNCFFTCSIC